MTEFCSIPRKEVEKMKEEIVKSRTRHGNDLYIASLLQRIYDILTTYSKKAH